MIVFNKTKEPYGWLGNMSAHPIKHDGRTWRTAEALFQAMRYNDETIKLEIWAAASPIVAKMKAKKHAAKRIIEPISTADIDNMRTVLRLKLDQHRHLKAQLLATGEQEIIEDCTKRKYSPWGASLKNGVWVGDNILGKLWVELRAELRLQSAAAERKCLSV